MKSIQLLILLFCLLASTVQAQIAINEDNSLPDSTALLDIKSTDKGILIPRMSTIEREAINSPNDPATGLMVYDNSTNSFWYYSGIEWTEMSTGNQSILEDEDNDTKIQVEETADEDQIRIDIKGSERMVIRESATGATLLELPNNNRNVFIGQAAGELTEQTNEYAGRDNIFIGNQAGTSNTTGTQNVFTGSKSGISNITGSFNIFIGSKSGFSNTTSSQNVFTGQSSGYYNTTGSYNVFTGRSSGYFNTTGSQNVFIGLSSGWGNTTGSQNVFTGSYSGFNNETGSENVFTGLSSGATNTTGSENVYLGYQSGYSNLDGIGNICIGNQAGYNETGSDKLYIANTDTINPLIYGEFDNEFLKINGELKVTEKLAINHDTPDVDLHIKQSSTTAAGSGGAKFEHIADNTNYWKIYHSGLHFSFADQGVRVAYVEDATGAWITTSDISLKKNIVSLSPTLDKVKQLRPVEYHYNTQSDKDKKVLGFIAQEVQPLFPEIVAEGEDGKLGMSYANIGVIAIKAIQEQEQTIEQQKEEIAALKKQNAAFEERLKRIEAAMD